ncbi:MAG: LPS export ABC transporter periplasmic protein LptC [Alphaproteobacteria bacterium]
MSKRPLFGEQVIQRRRPDAVSERYSRFVGLMKVVLPMSAAALAALVVAWPYLEGRDSGMPLSFANVEATTAEALFMRNARYFGSDDRDQPFTVTADSVIQADDQSDTIRFTLPKADILLSDGAWLALTADRGTLRRSDQTLLLDGAVNIFSDEGYEFRTERAEIDLSTSVARGNVAIEGQGPFGILNADTFRLDRDNRSIRFEGQVRLVLYPKAGI